MRTHRSTLIRHDVLEKLPAGTVLDSLVLNDHQGLSRPHPLGFVGGDGRITSWDSQGRLVRRPFGDCTQFQITHRAPAPEGLLGPAELAAMEPGRRLRGVETVAGARLPEAVVVAGAAVCGLDGIGRAVLVPLRDVAWVRPVGPTASIQRCRREGARWRLNDTAGRRRLKPAAVPVVPTI